jgi:hypothetical protein
MNPMDSVLQDEISRLMDRLSASVPEGGLDALARTPTLRKRLDEVEAQMAVVRATLLEGYGRWQRALEDVENLWALAAWRETAEGSAAEEPAQPASALAA